MRIQDNKTKCKAKMLLNLQDKKKKSNNYRSHLLKQFEIRLV